MTSLPQRADGASLRMETMLLLFCCLDVINISLDGESMNLISTGLFLLVLRKAESTLLLCIHYFIFGMVGG